MKVVSYVNDYQIQPYVNSNGVDLWPSEDKPYINSDGVDAQLSKIRS